MSQQKRKTQDPVQKKDECIDLDLDAIEEDMIHRTTKITAKDDPAIICNVCLNKYVLDNGIRYCKHCLDEEDRVWQETLFKEMCADFDSSGELHKQLCDNPIA